MIFYVLQTFYIQCIHALQLVQHTIKSFYDGLSIICTCKIALKCSLLFMDFFFVIFQIIIHLYTKYYLLTNPVLDVGPLTEDAQQVSYILHFNCKQATTV